MDSIDVPGNTVATASSSIEVATGCTGEVGALARVPELLDSMTTTDYSVLS
jgi:hypothetical protein